MRGRHYSPAWHCYLRVICRFVGGFGKQRWFMKLKATTTCLICTGLMTACSGGGGGGDAIPQQASQLTLGTTPLSIQCGMPSGGSDVGIATVTFTVSNWATQTDLYFNAFGETGVVSDVTFRKDPNASVVTASVSCEPPWWLGDGTFDDSLLFVVSTDAAGNNQITDSPINIPVACTVSGPTISSISPYVVEAGGPSFTLPSTGLASQHCHLICSWVVPSCRPPC